MKSILADRTTLIDASGIRKVFALAGSLENPVNLSIGQPDFDIPEPLKQRAVDAIMAGYNGYTQTAGDDILRQRIAAQLAERFGWKAPEVLVTSGVSGGLLLAFLSMINPGDEVIIPDPYFVIYKHLINMLGGKCVFVDSYPDFDLPVEKIAAAIGPKTKMVILNCPCNPTGAVYSQSRLDSLARVAAENNVVVLSDRIYETFSYDGPCPNIAGAYPNTIVMSGFSKTYAMTGWRVGYAAADGPLAAVIEQMTKIQQYTFVCAPSPFQMAAIAAMDYDVSDMVEAYARKRDLVYEGLIGKFELTRPSGAFYAFAKAPGGSGSEFVKKAVARGVLVIPGGVFSERDTHFRISYAASDDRIKKGIEILNGLA